MMAKVYFFKFSYKFDLSRQLFWNQINCMEKTLISTSKQATSSCNKINLNVPMPVYIPMSVYIQDVELGFDVLTYALESNRVQQQPQWWTRWHLNLSW